MAAAVVRECTRGGSRGCSWLREVARALLQQVRGSTGIGLHVGSERWLESAREVARVAVGVAVRVRCGERSYSLLLLFRDRSEVCRSSDKKGDFTNNELTSYSTGLGECLASVSWQWPPHSYFMQKIPSDWIRSWIQD